MANAIVMATRALRQEKQGLLRKLSAVEKALDILGDGTTKMAPVKKRRKRKPLTTAQKRAISRRMKASWARRKKAAKKTKKKS